MSGLEKAARLMEVELNRLQERVEELERVERAAWDVFEYAHDPDYDPDTAANKVDALGEALDPADSNRVES